MFTMNVYLKLALIVLFLGGGIVLAFIYGLGYSWILILIGIILLLSYIFLGTVNSTAKQVQAGDFEKAEKTLNMTLSPKLLYVTNRAMYYIMKGSMAVQKKENKIAEEHFQTALNLKLPTDNERGMVLLQLASINANRNNWTAAKKYYRDTQKLDITEGQIKSQLDMMGQALKQSGQQKLAGTMAGKRNRGMMMRPGGKRRRPKAR